MNRKADPCTDFYEYACGGYISSHPLPDDGAAVSRSDGAFYATESAVTTLLEETMTSTSMTPESVQLRAFNTACLTSNSSRTHLQGLLAKIDAITPDAGLSLAVADLHADGVDVLFGFDSTLDLMQPRQVIAELYDTGIGLPDRTYYTDAAQAPVLEAYRAHIAALSAALGVNDPQLPAAVVALETELASAMLTRTEARDPLAQYHPSQRDAVIATYPALDWAAYFTASAAPAFTSLNVTVPDFFATLDRVLRTTPLDDVKRYLRWRTLEAEAFQLDDAIIAEEYRFHYGTFYGFTKPLPRKVLCQRLTVRRLDWEISKLYVERHAASLKANVQPMVDTIKDRLYDDFGRLDWLDEPTRVLVRGKLDAMRTGVSAPDDFTPYLLGPLTFASDFPTAEAQRYGLLRAQSLAQIGTVWVRDWFMSPVTVNAAYSPIVNAINMPAAILQAPLYRSSFVAAVNYGAIGAIIGHEVTHGFDDSGQRFDEGGALRNMWTPSVQASFDERAQCVIDQYDAIEGAPGVKINGRLTAGENIADLGGVKLAYLALAPTGEKLESITDAQAFFLGYAQSWCANVQPEYAKTLLELDPHSPPKWRVNAVLQNTPEFATAWSCKQGQPMAPVKRCAVW